MKNLLTAISGFALICSLQAKELPFNSEVTSQSIGHLSIEESKFCNAFLVSNNLVLTNAHCVATQRACDDTYITFKNGDEIAGRYSCTKLVAVGKSKDVTKDYSLLRFEGDPGFFHGFIDLSDNKPAMGEKVWRIKFNPPTIIKENTTLDITSCLVGHMKELPDNLILKDSANNRCHAQSGNSGGAVINSKGKLVGLFSSVILDEKGSQKTLNIMKTKGQIAVSMTQILRGIPNLKRLIEADK